VNAEIAASPLTLSRTKIVPGETIFAIGNPEGLEKTISTGIVGALREYDGRKLIQITAPISHGSSGGPVLNAVGEVVGVTVAMLEGGQNLNFAVPTEILRELMEGKVSAPDLQSILHRVDQLQAQEDKCQYSSDANSDWQKTFREIQSLFKTALDTAGDNPELLLEIAEEARNKDVDAELTAAERATTLKASERSEVLLGEALKSSALFVKAKERDDLLERAEKAFRSAIRLSKLPTNVLYFGLADVLEDRGSTQEARLDFERALKLSKSAGDGEVSGNSLRGLVRTSFALNRISESESWFTALVSSGSSGFWDWRGEGERLFKQKKFKDAGDAYLKSATMGGPWDNWCQAAVMYGGKADDDALSSARTCLAGC
jgi:tetratricopeptide (TPR) repeat protein